LIAGLRGDTLSGFRDSLGRLFSLKPEGVTVHALTLKRASLLRELENCFTTDASKMAELARDSLTARGYLPYYMYKQKGTLDNLENVGYSLPGYECLYNIFIMDERHTILSCGAGGVTKLVDQRNGFVKRIFNYKYAREYIEGFETVLGRKEGIKQFYEGFE
ncbi:MAG: coproporphyrinogen dehydrogenase HemZ, partial [Oscillospiraceae bacterium]|nr:coproporphyrinogen dehydrogenase HemZ [Oscillospiraceae bacterium]